MKKIITIACLSLSSFVVFSQSSVLPEPFPQPPSNSNFYYKNLGQVIDQLGVVRHDVKYYTVGSYPSLYLSQDMISFCDIAMGDTTATTPDTLRRIDMRFICDKSGGDRGSEGMIAPCATVKQYEESQDHLNYYLPHCGAGITDVKGYARIVYENVYPYVDVHLYSNSYAPKMFFVIRPGGNPADIQLKFEGQDSIMSIVSTLRMFLGSWELTLPNAHAYEINSSTNANAMLSWLPVWNHSGGGNVNISTGSYNSSNTLVIAVGGGTPLGQTNNKNLDWSVYYGADGEQRDARITADNNYVFHAMTQLAYTFPPYNGQGQFSPNSRGNWCISMFEDTKRWWATYYGGSADDWVSAINVHKNFDGKAGALWVGGWTNSPDVLLANPTGGFQQSLDAGNPVISTPRDGLLASFNIQYGYLQHSTYIGSEAEEFISALAIDEESDMLYVAGGTRLSTAFTDDCNAQTNGTFPLCSGNGYYFKGAKNSSVADDAFIMQFRLSDMSLQWSTLFGGEDYDEITFAKVHKGKLYLGGTTFSQNLDEYPALATTHNTDRFPLAQKVGSFFQNSSDVVMKRNNFISCFTPDKRLLWSTLLGNGFGIRGLEFNSKEDLYVLSAVVHPSYFTPSSNIGNAQGKVPTYNNSVGHYEATASNQQGMALLKFNPDLQLTWGTKLYSTTAINNSIVLRQPSNYRGGLAIDNQDRVYVVNEMDTITSPSFPLQLNGAYWQSNNAVVGVSSPTGLSFLDNFIYAFDNQDKVKWATFFGGAANTLGSLDVPQGIVCQGKYIYITGMTDCPASPYTYWPYSDSYNDDTYNPSRDVFISRFNVDVMSVGIKGINNLESQINVYPNPSDGIYHVYFENDNLFNMNEPIQLQIVDQLGKLVAEKKVPIQKGANHFSIDIAKAPAGIYLLKLFIGNNSSTTVKIIKE